MTQEEAKHMAQYVHADIQAAIRADERAKCLRELRELKRYSVGTLGEKESDVGPWLKFDDVAALLGEEGGK